MDNGWIKLYRSLKDDCLWQTSTASLKVVMVTLLLMANYEEKEWMWNGQKFKCKPGQTVTSIAKIKEKCGSDITEGAVRCALKKLEKHGFITNVATKTGRLITIVNWGVYQGSDDGNYKQDSKETTKKVQRNYKRATPNKKDKKDKKINNTTEPALPDGEQPVWMSEGFASEKDYIKFLRGE